MWTEVYEHEEFGEIAVTWHGQQPTRTHLIAIAPMLFVPAEEVEACVRWAQNLQDDYMTRGGDAVTVQQR